MGGQNSSGNGYCMDCIDKFLNPKTLKRSTLNINYQNEKDFANKGQRAPKSPRNIELQPKKPMDNLKQPLLEAGPSKVPVKKPKATKRVTKDDFQFIRVLGRGSFGKVYLVQKRDNKKYYALKSLKKEEVINKNQKENAMTEKSVLQKSNFPFVVQLKYSFQSETMLYFVMDYLPGGELFSHLRRKGKFNEETTRFYAAEVVQAVEYLHNSLNIIYRDLKPENILLDAEGHIKVTDFGLAKASTKTFSFCGTPEYLAPEVIKKKGHGKEVDWWSLGCLIYEMLAGYPPYQNKVRKELFGMIVTTQPIIPSHFSPKAQDIVAQLLMHEPKQRLGFTSSEEVKKHPFFADIDWNALLARKLVPPIKPKLQKIDDTQNFDPHFTKEPLEETPQSLPSDAQRQLFKGFTFQESAIPQDYTISPPSSFERKGDLLHYNNKNYH
jgi:protein-serine/threonine kinase